MADAQAIAAAIVQGIQPLIVAVQNAVQVPPVQLPAAPAPVNVVQVAFALTPAQARTALLNYELPGDAKIFTSATAKLPNTFSLAKPNVSILLAELNDRANSSAWTTTTNLIIGAVPATVNPPLAAIAGTAMNLFKD